MVSDGYRFAVPVLVLGVLFALLHLYFVAAPVFAVAGFLCYFFRNPAREIPQGANLVVSPADGRVVKISQTPDGGQSVSIFLNIFNVHLNRSPISGTLERFEYRRGRFKVAFDEEASRVNEQNILTIAGEGTRVVVRQVAGLIARRVVCWKKPGHNLERGELIGLIRFGSRVDVLMPAGVKLAVKVGDRVRGGSSVLAQLA